LPGSPERFKDLLELIIRLRSPKGGCPWDIKQDSRSVGRYLIEEAYEVLDALDYGKPADLREELGDLLFQILFLARIEEEKGRFDIGDVLREITEKMVRRHPHVFGDTTVSGAEEVKANWETIKSAEKAEKGLSAAAGSRLGKVPRSMPSLLRAQKLTENASKVGFDWNSVDGILAKIEEEIGEFRASLAGGDREDISSEIGDMLFSTVNLARFLGISADDALRSSIQKFTERFLFVEETLKEQGRDIETAGIDEMDALWEFYKNKHAGVKRP
jgi:tetrapyrrole methylase family protein/MazG family protein